MRGDGPTVGGAKVRALRHAREIVYDLRWLGVAVPPLYAHMAQEFQALVGSGDYAAWVATDGKGPGRAAVAEVKAPTQHGGEAGKVPVRLGHSPLREAPSEPLRSGPGPHRHGGVAVGDRQETETWP